MSNAIQFSGTGANCFDEFLVQFKLVAAINQWPESNLALILGAYLQGPALAYFKLIYKENLDFKSICDLIRAEFPASIDYVEKFYNARQGTNEDIMAFFYSLADLALKANITDEKIFIKIFLKGVTSDYKLKLGTKLYASKAELRATLEQIKEIFNELRPEGFNMPIIPPKGILTKVRIEHPLSVESQRSPRNSRPPSPTPSPSAETPPCSSRERREEESFHTPRYHLRPRYPFTNRYYRSPIAPSSNNPQQPRRPNDQGHRR